MLNSSPPSLFNDCFVVIFPSEAFKFIVLSPSLFIAFATVCPVTAWFPVPAGTVTFPPVEEVSGVEFVNVNDGVVTPLSLITVFPPFVVILLIPATVGFKLYFTSPFDPTVATVLSPSLKSNPFANVVVKPVPLFAL